MPDGFLVEVSPTVRIRVKGMERGESKEGDCYGQVSVEGTTLAVVIFDGAECPILFKSFELEMRVEQWGDMPLLLE